MQEIFQGLKYKLSVEEEGFVYKLTVCNPTHADMGKFTCDINGITTSAYLDVEGIKQTVTKYTGKIFSLFFNVQQFYRKKSTNFRKMYLKNVRR